MISFKIQGIVRQKESGVGIPNLFVKAYDKDLLFDDLLGSAYTQEDGTFEIYTESEDFRDLFELQPDIYLKIFKPNRKKLLFSSKQSARFNAGKLEFFDISIPAKKLGTNNPKLEVEVVDENGNIKDNFNPGESIVLNLKGLTPRSVFEIRVSDGKGKELFTSRLISDTKGQIKNNTLWPQFGLDDPAIDKVLSIEEAHKKWAGKTLLLELLKDKKVIGKKKIKIPKTFKEPMIIGSDENGVLRNGFVAGEQDAVVSIYEPRSSSDALVYMVESQRDWQEGNPFTPVVLNSGRSAITEVALKSKKVTRARLAKAKELRPGTYDLIVRHVRYGYEDDDDFRIRASDIVTRVRTGLVVREEFMESKFALGGCVNTTNISGRKLIGRPYFQFANSFQVGEDVYAALDPNALDPAILGKMVALYVIPHKNPAAWTADNSLNHLAVLGGNANVPKVKVFSGCINANDHLVWPNATAGEYDIVADLGNNVPDAASFVPDNQYNSPTDIIDGYYLPGFRVVQDPGIDTRFPHAGTFSYDEGPFTVQDDQGNNKTVDIKAEVYFPADSSGTTTASQISASDTSYPMVIVIHGNSSALTSYQGYSYLLEHLAKNGFIAASIHLNPGMRATDRARIAFKHIQELQTKFGTKAANNIGLMGHSRGGEAVAAAVRHNSQDGLGFNINAIIALAPTDRYTFENISGAWATPFMCIYGSMDGDVSGPSQTGFRLYDRASGAEKSMVFVYGSTHGRYNTVWGDTDITASWSSLGPTDVASRLINMDAHQKIAKSYMNAFFRTHLKNEIIFDGMYKGEWIPSTVATADSGKARLFFQFQGNTFKMVDNFEGAHSPTSWQTNTLGGSVTDGNTLPVDPSENTLASLDSHSPHATAGLLLRWDSTTDFLRFDIPNAHKNVSNFFAISFRITQRVDSSSNPVNQAQDLYLSLEDSGGNNRSLKVSKFGEIPEPHKRDINSKTKSAMCTVRIPLHVYTMKVAGLVEVDLQNVVKIGFEYSAKPTGEVEIDSIQFTD